jgi:hypothetical protein
VLDPNCDALHAFTTDGAPLEDLSPAPADGFAGGLGGGLATHSDGSVYALAEYDGAPLFVRVYP